MAIHPPCEDSVSSHTKAPAVRTANISSVPGTVLCAALTMVQANLTTTLGVRCCCCPHLTDEGMKDREVKSLSKGHIADKAEWD